jgi:hypothetical protein
MSRLKNAFFVAVVIWLNVGQACFSAKQDLVFEGVYEAALDLPRIYFLVKRDINKRPLNQKQEFEAHYAFLDTGASGILLSSETANSLGIPIDAEARFVDISVGGPEDFNVSAPLFVCLAGFESQNPQNQRDYECFGPWRVQVKKSAAGLLGEPIDVVGMPAMAGNIVLLNSGATNSLDYFAADIKKPNDRIVQKADFKVALRPKKFTNPQSKENVPPLPVSVDNMVIDNVLVRLGENYSRGTWLLDTGATVSMISTTQARKLGLIDGSGQPLKEVAFSVPVGGIGQMEMINGFEVDKLIIPTTEGRNLVFKNARIGVHDIKYFDVEKKAEVVIDGVLGSNFLCSSAKMEGLFPSDVSQTPFDNIIIDLRNNTLGFDLRENFKPLR